MPHETYEKWLPCPLTDEEFQIASDALAEQTIARNKLESEKKDVAKSYTERIGSLDDEIAVLARKVKTRSEDRPINVNVELDFQNKTRNHVREDTGEIILEESLRAEDSQESMNL